MKTTNNKIKIKAPHSGAFLLLYKVKKVRYNQDMKHKFRKSLLAIIFAPFALTLMANSTAPRPVEEEYEDFTYTLVSKTYNSGSRYRS